MEKENFEITITINKSATEEQEIDLYNLDEFNVFKNRKIICVNIKNASSKETYHILREINKDYLIDISIQCINDYELIFNFDFPDLTYLSFFGISKLVIDFNAPKLHTLHIKECNILVASNLKNKCFPFLDQLFLTEIKMADLSFITNYSFPKLIQLFIHIKNARSILSLLTQEFEKLEYISYNYARKIKFYDLPYKKYLSAKLKVGKAAAKKLIKLADVYKIVYQYIDIVYTKQLIDQIKKLHKNNSQFIDFGL